MRALIALLAVTPTALAHAQDEARPNVVILLADDLGVGDLGCYGQTRIRTPHIDALASEGVRMQRAYAAGPVCAPSRCALLTGLHSGHCSVDHNDEPNLPIGLSDPTLAEILARAGYRTGLVGKWGLGGETDEGAPFATFSLPTEMGFEHALAVLDQERAQDHYPERVFEDGAWRELPGNAGGARGTWDDDLFIEDALSFVDAARDDERPFLLYFASTLPHRELDPPVISRDDAGWPDAERAYATMVERFDADVGRIVERVDALSGRDTIVIVASDNGPVGVDGHDTAFFGSTAGLRGQKRDLYEGGLRVPLVVRWRGHLEPRAPAVPVALYDIFPTIGDLVRVPAPAGMDGVAIGPWLRGERWDAVHPRLFFSAHEASGGTESVTRFALHEGALVLIERADGVRELYDLDVDPGQAHDLAGARPGDVERLHEARLAETTGPVARAFPILDVRDEQGHAMSGATAVSCMQVLDLRGSGDPLTLASEAPIELAITGHLARASDDAIELPSGAYVTVAAHPALSLGQETFTVRARVRLDHVVTGVATTRQARRYLALSKPAGTPDAWLDWGLLVQAGDLALAGDADASGHELAFVFANPDVGGHGTWTIVTRTLAITDGAWHDVTFQYDAARGSALVQLDGQRETIPVVDRGHVRSDGPLVVGAHHDLHGAFDGFLDGAIGRLEVARGLAAAAEGCPGLAAARTLRVDLGTIPVGAEVHRRFEIQNAALAPALAMDVVVDVEPDDDRILLELPRAHALTPEAAPLPLLVRVRADRPGPIDAFVRISGTTTHTALDPNPRGRAPRLEIVGEVVAADPDASEVPVWLPFVAAALIALGIRMTFAARKTDRPR